MSGSAVTTVALVRHGQAVCNVSGVIGGRTGCTGLTAEGRAQVEVLAARLRATQELGEIGAVYASPLRRATETADILSGALGHGRAGASTLVPRIDCALCELHPGEADGMTWGRFTAHYGEPNWDQDPDAPIAPGGESWRQFVARAAAAVVALTEAHPGETVLVATHAGVVEATMLRLLPVEPAVTRLELLTGHASLTVWARDGARWTLQRYNDQAHLAFG